MKTPIYLKRILPFTNAVWTAKIMDGKTLECDGDKIEVRHFDESIEHEISFYKDSLEYRDSDKETFDNAFIKSVKEINELSNV